MNHEPMKTNLPFVAALALAGLAIMILFGLAAPKAQAQTPPSHIDYSGFVELTTEVAAYRESRLIDLETFNAMKADPDTIILDARSAGNYALGHIDGAVNLNIADFTDGMLAEVIGSKKRRILIYCNNNFSDNVAPMVLKSAPLALNVPTFINLYGYGYENVYELAGSHSMHDPAIDWVSRPTYQ
jgi:phage shock protein E